MSFHPLALLLLTLTTLSSAPLLAADTPMKGPHGGHVMTQDGCQYEVVLDEEQNKVEIYATRLPTPTPSQLTLQVKKGNKILDKVNLELMESHQDIHRFQGAFSWHQQSSAGVQFRIELGSSKGRSK